MARSLRLRLRTPTYFGIAAFIGLAIASHVLVSALRTDKEQEFRSEILDDTYKLVAHLESELHADVYLANGLAATVANRPGTYQENQETLKALFGLGRHLRNIAFAPGNRISNVYPLKGNEAALGLYYPDIAEQWASVERAIERRTTVVSGPVKLRQGGIGLISRTPVFLNDGSYWGMLSLVINNESLFNTVGIASEAKGRRYAMRGRDGLGAQGETFLGDPLLFEQGAIIHTFSVPGGEWQIATLPIGGWTRGQGMLDALEAASLFASALLGFLLRAYLVSLHNIEAGARRVRTLLETVRDGVIVIDQRGIIEEFNPAAERLFGYSAQEIIGERVNKLMPFADAVHHDAHLQRTTNPQTIQTMAKGRQVRGLRKDGCEFPLEATVGHAVIDGRTVFIGVIRDITERQNFERQLLELATTDSLTGTANRRAIMEALERDYSHAQRHHRPISILMIDADHFKQINDSFGHQVGDQVLIKLASVIQSCLRNSDRLGRIGGEEFIAILPDASAEQAGHVADRLLQAVAEASVNIRGHSYVKFTVSIGIATRVQLTTSADSLIEQADQALYQAKSDGRNCYRHYQESPSPSA